MIPAHSDGSGIIARDTSPYWTASATLRTAAASPIGAFGLVPYLDASLGRAQLSSSLNGDAGLRVVGRMAVGVTGTVGGGRNISRNFNR